MEKIKEVEKHIKEVLKRSKDTHNIHTPFELCKEMLSKIPDLNKDKQIFVMFNLEFLWLLREKFGKENMGNIWFLTPCEFKKKVAISIGINQNQIMIYSYKDKEIINKLKMPKFDVVVGNPPYSGNLYIKFLNIAYDISSECVLMVHPGTIYMNEKENKRQKIEIEYIKKVENKIEKLIILNGNKEFENIGLWVPLTVTIINKNKNSLEIKVEDKVKGENYIYENINKINKWGNYEEYFTLKEKILNYCKKDNLQNHFNYAFYMKEQKNSPYYVNLSQLRGHMSKSKIFAPDFYTMIPRDKIVENKINGQLYFCFNKYDEANNFLNYIKSKFARFCLSLYKINMQLARGELKGIPYLDFKEEWNDEKLYKYFKLNESEIKFIEENISNYY